MENNPTLLVVVAVALLRGDGHVLMQQRRFDSDHGGLWEFPGGKVEPGESPEVACRREILEELGVEIDPALLEPVSFAVDPPRPRRSGGPARGLVLLLHAVRHWTGEPQCLDGAAIAWTRLDALSALSLAPLDVALAAALEKNEKGACHP